MDMSKCSCVPTSFSPSSARPPVLKPEWSSKICASFAGSDKGTSLSLWQLERNTEGDENIMTAAWEKPDNWFYRHPFLFHNSFSEDAQHRSTQSHLYCQNEEPWATETNLEKTHMCTHPGTVFVQPFHPSLTDPIQHQACIWLNIQAAPEV